MKLILVILLFIGGNFFPVDNKLIMKAAVRPANKYHYLALGDSYTIGEMVSPEDNFPNQVYALMKNDAVDFQTPRIIAKTGWTTDELEDGIVAANKAVPLRSSYDFVSLLIGVNNQYRGRSVDNYKIEFEELLKKAIAFGGNQNERIIVLSIPDWGVTPFAEASLPDRQGRNREQITREIEAYNAVNKQIAEQYHVHYLNITNRTREATGDHSLLAPDGLHPSGNEYKRWAEQIAILFQQMIR
jgi:lysophospholipase L1-like esterase